jgi:hypothetical protein
MVDRSTFRRLNHNYQFPTPVAPRVEEKISFQERLQTARNPDFDACGNPVPLSSAQNGNVNTTSLFTQR